MPKQEKCVNGSDLLLLVKGKAIGHCTTHQVQIQAETADRAFKAPASQPQSKKSLFKKKTIKGLSVTISAEGLVFFGEEEGGCAELMDLILAGEPVEVQCFVRSTKGATGGADSIPYLSGQFVMTSHQHTGATDEDATYNVQLENDGEVKGAKEALADAETIE